MFNASYGFYEIRCKMACHQNRLQQSLSNCSRFVVKKDRV